MAAVAVGQHITLRSLRENGTTSKINPINYTSAEIEYLRAHYTNDIVINHLDVEKDVSVPC